MNLKQLNSCRLINQNNNQYMIEHQSFQVFLKKESVLLSQWRSIKIILIESPHKELMMTIRDKENSRIIEVINISHSRLAKKITKVGMYNCFGVIVPSSQRYYFACTTAQKTISLYFALTKLKKEIRIKKQSWTRLTLQNEISRFEDTKNIFSKSLQHHRNKSVIHDQQGSSTNTQEINYPYTTRFQRQQYQQQQIFVSAIEDKEYQSSIIKTNHEDYNKIENKEFLKEGYRFKKKQSLQSMKPLVIQQPISLQEVQCMQSDQGFNLLYSFDGGRLLSKSQRALKASLSIRTDFSVENLLEAIFHFQLWNQKVKCFKVITRIDKGILLAKLQLHKRNFLSLPRYCYMMVTTCKVKGEYVVVFRTLEQSNYEKQSGYTWIKMDVWAKVQSHRKKDKKVIKICASFKDRNDYQEGLMFFNQIKNFQVFLETTGKLPKSILEWNEQADQIQEIDDSYT